MPPANLSTGVHVQRNPLSKSAARRSGGGIRGQSKVSAKQATRSKAEVTLGLIAPGVIVAEGLSVPKTLEHEVGFDHTARHVLGGRVQRTLAVACQGARRSEVAHGELTCLSLTGTRLTRHDERLVARGCAELNVRCLG